MYWRFSISSILFLYWFCKQHMYALFIQLNLFYTEKKKLIHDVTAEVYFYKKKF